MDLKSLETSSRLMDCSLQHFESMVCNVPTLTSLHLLCVICLWIIAKELKWMEMNWSAFWQILFLVELSKDILHTSGKEIIITTYAFLLPTLSIFKGPWSWAKLTRSLFSSCNLPSVSQIAGPRKDAWIHVLWVTTLYSWMDGCAWMGTAQCL